MTKAKINRLLCRCISHEMNTTTPERRRYWDARYKHFRALAVRLGWID